MKRTLLLAGMIASGYAFGQEGRVGINTENPKAALQVTAKEADKAKGILIPSQTGDELKTNSTSLTTDQEGMISYITEGVSTTDAVSQNVQFKGLHRLNVASDNTKSWVRLEPSGLEKVKYKTGNTTNIGYRLVGTNPDYYKGLGNNAIDFSIREAVGTTKGGATGDYSVVIGGGSNTDTREASGEYSMVIGGETGSATGKYSIVLGGGTVSGTKSLSLGSGFVTGSNSISLGGGMVRGNNAVGIAGNVASSGEGSVAIGSISSASADYAIAIGRAAIAFGDSSVSIGNAISTNGANSITIGSSINTYNAGEIALGHSNFNTDGTNSIPWERAEAAKSNGKAQLFSVGAGHYVSDDIGTDVQGNAMIVLRDGSTGIALRHKRDQPATGKPTETLDVNGNIRVRGAGYGSEKPIGENKACDNPGTIAYNGNFYGCTADNLWKKLNN